MFHTFKLILLGDSAVGKTTFIHKLLSIPHLNLSETIGIDFRFLPISHPNFKCIIWDSSGNPRFRPIIRAYYQQTHVVLFMYSCRSKSSLLNLVDWIDFYFHSNQPLLAIILANDSHVSQDDDNLLLLGQQLAQKHKFLFYDTKHFTLHTLKQLLIPLQPPRFFSHIPAPTQHHCLTKWLIHI